MQVETSRFGAVEVPDDEVVTFADGLPGFAGPRSMVLLGAGDFTGAEAAEGHHSLYWLQDVADPDLAFLTTVPWSAYPDYDIDVDPAELGELSGAEPDDLCVLSIITVRRDDGTVRLTSNLRAPVVIDTRRRVGMQLILQDVDWPVQAPLAEAPTPGGAQPVGGGS